MSVTDVTTTDVNTDTNDAPVEQKRTPRRRTTKARTSTNKRFTKEAPLSQVVASVSAARGIDTTKGGKLVRSFIRGNYDSLARGTKGLPKWGGLARAKENRDGNRYPAMPASVANAIIERLGKKRGA